MNEKKLNTFDLVNILLRSFFIQAAFTYKSKLGMGFGFSILPGIKKVKKERKEIADIVLKHSEFFNCHPYLSTYIIGAVINAEEASLDPSENDAAKIETFKERLSGICGSLGDRLFWKYLKPVVSLISICIIFVFQSFYPWNAVIGIILFIAVYNAVHIAYRWDGLKSSYNEGFSIIRSKKLFRIEKINKSLVNTSLFFIGLIIILEIDILTDYNYFSIAAILIPAILLTFLNKTNTSHLFNIAAGMGSAFIIYLLSKVVS